LSQLALGLKKIVELAAAHAAAALRDVLRALRDVIV
jgi:hypothetical protein